MTTINAVNNGLSGQTGTGLFVGNLSPAITTPSITTSIKDANGNNILGFTPQASAVNYFNFTSGASGVDPIFSATGAGTNLILTVQGKGNGGVAIQGNSSGIGFSSGYVGEIMSNTAISSAVSLTNNVAANITSITLTPGVWTVTGRVIFAPAGTTTIQLLEEGISLTSATMPSSTTPTIGESIIRFGLTSFTTGGIQVLPVSPVIQNVSTNTTVYLVALANFGVSTMTAGGVILAQRIQ